MKRILILACAAARKDYMVFCLHENDADASFLSEPKKAPCPSFRP